MTYTKNIIHRGINELIEDNQELFKQNLMYALAFKLNESVESIKINTQNKLLMTAEQNTVVTEDIQILLNFLESYKESPTDKILLKDNSVININEEDIKSVKMLFEGLSPENRQKMAESIFENNETFKQHINFYKDTKGLI